MTEKKKLDWFEIIYFTTFAILVMLALKYKGHDEVNTMLLIFIFLKISKRELHKK